MHYEATFRYHLFHVDLFLTPPCELVFLLALQAAESYKKQTRTLFEICLKIMNKRKQKVQRVIKMHVCTQFFFL